MNQSMQDQIARLNRLRALRMDAALDLMHAEEKTVGYDKALRRYARKVGQAAQWYELELRRIQGLDND